jgi:rSAM/selenodomain-associated transferase 1
MAPVVTLVFARAPVPGRAKTRLAPRLGAWGAARLQERLTWRAVRAALRARCGAVELHGTPRARHAAFRRMSRALGVPLKGQHGSDLGERMHRALAQALRRHRSAILIGTDCPSLGAREIARAARLLAGGCDVVLAPAEDGGYGLIGARRVSPALFERIEWGGAQVYGETLERLAALGWRWRALLPVWDIDRPEDLARLRARHFS